MNTMPVLKVPQIGYDAPPWGAHHNSSLCSHSTPQSPLETASYDLYSPRHKRRCGRGRSEKLKKRSQRSIGLNIAEQALSVSQRAHLPVQAR
jgi:hypothetical protein